MTRSVYLPMMDTQTIAMFKQRGWDLAESHEDADAVCFTGGADITTILYGERPLPYTKIDIARDLREVKLIKNLPSKLPKIGICRGAQLLNVMCGGTMWQHVDGHAIHGQHDMHDLVSGEILMVTSTHHQMMDPGPEAFWLGVSKEAKQKERDGMTITEPKGDKRQLNDVEALYYEHANAFCYQPHPEYVKPGHRCQEYFFDMVDMYCFNQP